MSKTPARLMTFDQLKFVPRAEGGDQAQIATLCGCDDGSALGAGFARLKNAHLEWTVKYDEVLHVIEGSIKVHTPQGILHAGPRDSIWLPANTPLIYEADDALVLFAIHPANWAEQS
ncbi:MAG: hypothetical protein WBD37_16045 [Anderseniella sp.]